MPADEAFAEHIKEQLAPLGRISVRRMFGAAGVFVDGLMFAIISAETLFLKADEETRGDFEAEGLAQISYEKQGKSIPMAFWQAPDRLLDDDEEMQAWARKAIAVARRGSAKNQPARKGRAAPGRKAKARGQRT